jgi:hypothetical protein
VNAWVDWWGCASGMFSKVWCSGPSTIVGKIWVESSLGGGRLMSSCGGVSSRCKRWLTLLGGMSELSSGLKHGGHQILG